MATIIANATASLVATGQSTATGSISWTAPSLPSGVSAWDSITISGTWSWKGKGNITNVDIYDTSTFADIAFNIDLRASVTSPLSITCSGNKNATGDSFTWSNLIVTYAYTDPTARYNVSVGTVVNGTVTLNHSGSVEPGAIVSITAIPMDGYEVGNYYVNSSKISGTSFTVTEDSIVTVDFTEIPEQLYFKDGSTWITVTEMYKKINGTWVLQDTVALDSSMKYVRKL